MIKQIKLIQLPEKCAIRRIAFPFKEIIKIIECDEPGEVLEAARTQYPLELMLIAENDKNNTITKHFLIGLAIPSAKDKFTSPMLYFSVIKDDHYQRIKNMIEDYKKNKSTIYKP